MKNVKTGKFEKSPELAEVQVSYKIKLKDIVRVTNSREAFNILYPLFDVNTIGLKEEFFLLLLNYGSYVLGWFKLSSGGIAGTVVDPRIIFMLALKTNACKVILCHNYPSGNAKESSADVNLTKRIKEAGKLLEIELLDHMIVCPNSSYMSMSDEGII